MLHFPSFMNEPALSLVVRTLNSANTLPQVLGALRRGPADQLLIVDSGSTDGTLELAGRHGAEIVPIRRDDFTYGRALNLGFAAARHDWVLSLSSHTVPMAADFLARYRTAAARFPAEVTAAVGPLVTLGHEASLSGGITYFEKDDLRHGFGFGAGNPNSLYRRRAWQQRPFDETLGGGEDLHWYCAALRAGEVVAAIHAARVKYISQRGVKAFYLKGRVDYRAAAKLIEPYRPSLSGLLIHGSKLGLYAALGRGDWLGAKSSVAHYFGNWMEARALQRVRMDRRLNEGAEGDEDKSGR